MGWLLERCGQDSLDSPFTLQPNQHVLDATITFADRLAQLSGTVQDAAGRAAPDYTIVLFPAEPALWVAQSRRLQGVRPSADGAYVIRNLPAGNYFVAAVDDVEPGEWFDPAFLQRLACGDQGTNRGRRAEGPAHPGRRRLEPTKPIVRTSNLTEPTMFAVRNPQF